MESSLINGLTLFFHESERDAAELIASACERSIPLIYECWGLETPEDCRVYVMTSWLHFVFHAAPWPWRIYLGLSFPLLYLRASRLWKYAGGWTIQYGRRRAVGIKPPRLIAASDRSIGDRIFIREDTIEEKVWHISCHELVHAFTAHLRLPMWLNEGLAMVTVDRLFEKPIVKLETIRVLERSSGQASPREYRKVSVKDLDSIVYHAVRGYWLTLYINETQPELLRSLLRQRFSHSELESKVAAAYGMTREDFWCKIVGMLVSHYGKGS